MSVALIVASVVVFVLAVFGVSPFGLSELEVVAAGLALFAAGHVVPPRG